jgi:hypothetical protein
MKGFLPVTVLSIISSGSGTGRTIQRRRLPTPLRTSAATHDLELLLDCCTDIVHFEDGSIIDKFQMDEAGLEKIRNYFIKGVPTK